MRRSGDTVVIQTFTPGQRTSNPKRSRLLILKRWIIHQFRRKPVSQVTKLCRSDAFVSLQAEEGTIEIQTVTPGEKDKQYQIVLPSDSKAVDDPLPPSDADSSGFQTVQFHCLGPMPPFQYKQAVAPLNSKLSLQEHRIMKTNPR